MNKQNEPIERVIGLDTHPDTFTAALVRGPTPAAAIVEKTLNKVALSRLQSWAKKDTTPADLFVLEASGNSFAVVRSLEAIGRQAKVLESCHLGQLKEAHANNDKISAVRIAKAYLAGTAKEVWVPDAKSQERRDWFHAYRKACKRNTQMRNRLLSYLSDNGVRLKKRTRLTQAEEAEKQLRQARDWSPSQWQVIELYLADLRHADQQRRQWHSLLAQEVLKDPQLLALVRLCGVRELTAFALGAFVGDIKRFEHPKQLVKYLGLNPAFDDSGNEQWSGGVGGRGHKILRNLLVEGAQAILRCSHSPLAQWGKRLLGRKGEINLVVAAMARKLAVAVWYLMMGRWTTLEEMDTRLSLKVGKIIGQIPQPALQQLGKSPKALREEAYASLKAGRVAAPAPAEPTQAPLQTTNQSKPKDQQRRQPSVYVLDPGKKFTPKAKTQARANGLAAEYGLR